MAALVLTDSQWQIENSIFRLEQTQQPDAFYLFIYFLMKLMFFKVLSDFWGVLYCRYALCPLTLTVAFTVVGLPFSVSWSVAVQEWWCGALGCNAVLSYEACC